MADNKVVADAIFECLRTIVYEPEKKIDVSDLPKEFDDVAEGLKLLRDWMKEQKKFATDLGNGDLSTPTPDKENIIVQPLKLLQSNLSHLTWQTKQVAKGDYSQQLDFMGDFSNSFNTMIHQLKTRRDKLNEDIEIISKKNDELSSMRNFLLKIMDGMLMHVCVLDSSDNVVYANRSFNILKSRDIELYGKLIEEMKKFSKNDATTMQVTITYSKVGVKVTETKYFAIEKSPVNWLTNVDYAYVIADITKEKENELKISKLAYNDELTGLYNRHYGMMELNKLVASKKQFCLCFIDLDNLKFVNDTFEHKDGDAYILSSVEALKTLPEPKIIARIGGDELMLAIENIKADELRELLEKLRDSLGNFDADNGVFYKRSFSYGLVESAENVSASMLLREADVLMYEYKYAHKPKIPRARS